MFRVGTRGSALAIWQAQWVVDHLRKFHPDQIFEIVEISTTGDRVRNRPIFQANTVGIFVKELEAALLDGEIDIAVHSMKDLPSCTTPGLTIAAVPEREDPRDVLISRHGMRLEGLPDGSKVGTSSRRRAAQVLALRPELEIIDIRGNVDTRLEKAKSEPYDAIVLAIAGLKRLGREIEITQILSPETMLPAAGQGALAIETREEDEVTKTLVSSLEHSPSRAAIVSERVFMNVLGGGCHAPMGAYSEVVEDEILVRCLVSSIDGKTLIRGVRQGSANYAREIGKSLAEELLENGARDLV